MREPTLREYMAGIFGSTLTSVVLSANLNRPRWVLAVACVCCGLSLLFYCLNWAPWDRGKDEES